MIKIVKLNRLQRRKMEEVWDRIEEHVHNPLSFSDIVNLCVEHACDTLSLQEPDV
jgi:hypothetical protein